MKRGKPWKYFLVFCALFLLVSPAFSECETELETEIIEQIEPEAVYEIAGEDLLILYQTIDSLEQNRDDWENFANRAMNSLKNAEELVKEYENENQQLKTQNDFLIGGLTLSVGITITGGIIWALMNALD